MSNWANTYPEDYEDRFEQMLERADYDRKRRREEGEDVLILGGDIVRVIKLKEEFDTLPKDTEGVVDYVDVEGGIHVNWDNGSLYVLTREDLFSVRKDR